MSLLWVFKIYFALGILINVKKQAQAFRYYITPLVGVGRIWSVVGREQESLTAVNGSLKPGQRCNKCSYQFCRDIWFSDNWRILKFMTWMCGGHWCIMSVYNGFTKAILAVPLKCCLSISVLSKSCLFSESSFGYLGEDI